MKHLYIRVSVFLVVLLAFTQCEQQIVGPVPNFDYEFPAGGIVVEDVTLEDVVPDDITPGSMNTDGQTAFGNNLANVNTNPAALAAVRDQLTALAQALSTSQKNAVKGLNVSTLPTQVKSGVSDPNSNLISLIATIQGLLKEYPQLAPLVPAITLPTGGRVLNDKGRVSEVTIPLIETQVNAVNAYEVDCEAAARRAYEINITKIDSAYNAQLKLVSDKNTENINAALLVRSNGITAANTRYTDRNTLFRSQYDVFAQSIANSTVFTPAEIELLNILNTLIYAIDLYNSTLLLNFELAAISNVFALNLEKAAAANTRMTNDATTKRNAAVQEADQTLADALFNTCHDQGGASGGD
ncbi:MAG: hypothetical protein RIE86_12970 [Imperialibacter sp.]|uniref:hypothetical protein n=1 Tax=Imperialibacter sp. TaxID=2038411 RepID=UPI0032EC5AC2